MRLRAAAALGLVLLALAAYANSLEAPFVFDDRTQILENPIVRDLGVFLHPSRADTTGASAAQLAGFRDRPVVFLTFALNYRARGFDVAGWHAVNVAIHLAAGLLLFAVVLVTLGLPRFDGSTLRGRETAVAFFAAALFLVHPLQTQAVTYVVQRMASLAGALCLLALAAWAGSRVLEGRAARLGLSALSLAALVAAMFAKQNAAAFPLVLLLWELLFGRGPLRARLAAISPHLATALLVPIRMLHEAPAGIAGAAAATRAGAAPERLDYLLTQFRVVASYLRLLVFPAGQTLDHDVRVSRSLLEPAVLGSLALLLALGALALVLALRPPRAEEGFRVVGFGVLWFFVALSVESSVVPIEDVMLEHRVYLPSAGLLVAAAAAVFLATPAPRARLAAAGLGAAVALLLGATIARNRVWSDPVAFWSDVVAKSPRKSRGWSDLGNELERAGDLPGAERAWRRALELDPASPTALTNLGTLAQRRGDLAAAERLLREAARVSPAFLAPRYYLGTLLASTGRLAEGRSELLAALSIQGSHSPTLNNLGNVALVEGDLAAAEELYRRALAADPGNAQAARNLEAVRARRAYGSAPAPGAR